MFPRQVAVLAVLALSQLFPSAVLAESAAPQTEWNRAAIEKLIGSEKLGGRRDRGGVVPTGSFGSCRINTGFGSECFNEVGYFGCAHIGRTTRLGWEYAFWRRCHVP